MFRLTVVFLLGALLGGRLLAANAAAVIDPYGTSRDARSTPRITLQSTIRNVRGLIAAVRGLPPVVCGLTAEAASGWGGGSRLSAPVTPLGEETATRVAW